MSSLGRLRTLYRTRRAVRWAVDALLFLAAVIAIDAYQTRHHLSRAPAPAFDLPTLQGAPISLASLGGKPTLLFFWAPWCGVCSSESDNISRVLHLAGGRANVVSISLASPDRAAVERFVQQHGVDYPVLLGDEATGQAWRVDSFPTVYVLDSAGRITGSAVGYTTTVGLLWRLLRA
jgi:peroxiredoxin